MSKNKPISDALENRLNSLKKNEYMDVMIIAKSKKGFKSLTNYFVEEGLSFDTITSLSIVNAYLKKDRIYSVAELNYVKAILENQKIYKPA